MPSKTDVEKVKKDAVSPCRVICFFKVKEYSNHMLVLCETLGVISNFELANMDTEELQEELRPQGVTDVCKIKQKRDGVFRNTPVIVLTFCTPDKPIKAGYMTVKQKNYMYSNRRKYVQGNGF